MTGPHPLAGIEQPGRHEPGRRQCAGCPKMAAIRRMTRGPDGQLYGSGCARKRGYITPRTPTGLRPAPARRPRPAEPAQTSLFDHQEDTMTTTTPTTTARRFVIERDDQRLLDGVLWPDGSCSLRWRQAPRSFVSWDTFADAESMHCGGDPAVSAHVVWIDEPAPEADFWTLRRTGRQATFSFNTRAMRDAGRGTQVEHMVTALRDYNLDPDRMPDNAVIAFDLDTESITTTYVVIDPNQPASSDGIPAPLFDDAGNLQTETVVLPYTNPRLPRLADLTGTARVEKTGPDNTPAPIDGVNRVQVRVTKCERHGPADPYVTLESIAGEHFTASSPVPGTDEPFFMAAWFDDGRNLVLRLPPFHTEVGTIVDAVMITAEPQTAMDAQ